MAVKYNAAVYHGPMTVGALAWNLERLETVRAVRNADNAKLHFNTEPSTAEVNRTWHVG
jgi:hypothetical protein